jgi:hypothetical protein
MARQPGTGGTVLTVQSLWGHFPSRQVHNGADFRITRLPGFRSMKQQSGDYDQECLFPVVRPRIRLIIIRITIILWNDVKKIKIYEEDRLVTPHRMSTVLESTSTVRSDEYVQIVYIVRLTNSTPTPEPASNFLANFEMKDERCCT